MTELALAPQATRVNIASCGALSHLAALCAGTVYAASSVAFAILVGVLTTADCVQPVRPGFMAATARGFAPSAMPPLVLTATMALMAMVPAAVLEVIGDPNATMCAQAVPRSLAATTVPVDPRTAFVFATPVTVRDSGGAATAAPATRTTLRHTATCHARQATTPSATVEARAGMETAHLATLCGMTPTQSCVDQLVNYSAPIPVCTPKTTASKETGERGVRRSVQALRKTFQLCAVATAIVTRTRVRVCVTQPTAGSAAKRNVRKRCSTEYKPSAADTDRASMHRVFAFRATGVLLALTSVLVVRRTTAMGTACATPLQGFARATTVTLELIAVFNAQVGRAALAQITGPAPPLMAAAPASTTQSSAILRVHRARPA